MEVLEFVATTVLVTASGALAPGPLFFANITHGAKAGAKSGLVFSVAHTVVEFTLVMLLAFGLLSILEESIVKSVFGVSGGTVLIVFGMLQIRGSLKFRFGESEFSEAASRKVFLLGLAFTGLNPFFIIWWLTAGAQLIIISLEFASLAGVVLMYLCHVWMDYAWLTATAYFAKKGMKIAGLKWYRFLIAVFGVVLVYFGLTFIIGSLT
jgi:threonine/homoserine/homoserine lactone efflux protein